MKNYQKKYRVANPTASVLSVIPEINNTNDPKVGEVSVLIYDNTGVYMGWCLPDAMKKFLYGKLYYKTKGAYSINTAHNHRYNKRQGTYIDKTISIKEKSTGRIALIAVTKDIVDDDLVDVSNLKDKAIYQLKHEIEPITFTEYNVSSIPDKYNIMPEFKKELIANFTAWQAELLKAKNKYYAGVKKSLMDHLQSVVDGEDALKAGSEEAGINIDF